MPTNWNFEKIKQSLAIGIILFGILATPAKMKINAIEKRLDSIDLQHKEQCIENDKKYSCAAVVEVQLSNIIATLVDIKGQLKDCRQSDKEFRDKLEQYVLRHKRK